MTGPGAKAALIDAPASDAIRARRFRVALAATVGNTLEWYDFLVYALLAVTIAKLFFPAGSELNSLLLSMATFGIGLVTRPVGAVVLGMYADRVGRKAALSLYIDYEAIGQRWSDLLITEHLAHQVLDRAALLVR